MVTSEKVTVRRVCGIDGLTGNFALLQKSETLSKIRDIDLATGQLGEERTVRTSMLVDERRYEAVKD